MDQIFISDIEFPQVQYPVSEQELITMLETDESLPQWWKDYYSKLLAERWNK